MSKIKLSSDRAVDRNVGVRYTDFFWGGGWGCSPHVPSTLSIVLYSMALKVLLPVQQPPPPALLSLSLKHIQASTIFFPSPHPLPKHTHPPAGNTHSNPAFPSTTFYTPCHLTCTSSFFCRLTWLHTNSDAPYFFSLFHHYF